MPASSLRVVSRLDATNVQPPPSVVMSQYTITAGADASGRME